MLKSEYQTYLASREWAVLREAVKARAGNRCERCRTRPVEQVHHRTYERLGEERLEDLQGLCEPCHEYLSAKRDSDPASPKIWRDAEVELRDGMLCCPCCRGPFGGNLHHSAVVVYEQHGKYENAEWLDISVVHNGQAITEQKLDKEARNPSMYRGGVVVVFGCEQCAAYMELTIKQHKGSTYMGWRYRPYAWREFIGDDEEMLDFDWCRWEPDSP